MCYYYCYRFICGLLYTKMNNTQEILWVGAITLPRFMCCLVSASIFGPFFVRIAAKLCGFKSLLHSAATFDCDVRDLRSLKWFSFVNLKRFWLNFKEKLESKAFLNNLELFLCLKVTWRTFRRVKNNRIQILCLWRHSRTLKIHLHQSLITEKIKNGLIIKEKSAKQVQTPSPLRNLCKNPLT